jgi:hypothetical protein
MYAMNEYHQCCGSGMSIPPLPLTTPFPNLKIYEYLMRTYLWEPVLRIRIRILMFLGLLDPDPFVRGIRIRIWILLSLSKNSKKNLGFYCFVTSFLLFIFENEVKVPPKSNLQKNFFKKVSFLLAS